MKKIAVILVVFSIIVFGCTNKLKMPDFYNKNYAEAKKFADKNNLEISYEEVYDDNIVKGNIIGQNIDKNKKINRDTKLVFKISKGIDYGKYNVDESGYVPIMMYHGIENINDEDTMYIGGNVDKDGYIRTAESFRRDLEFYYNNNYRMIRLKDYINGDIDTELGKSPIILTFDDGRSNNIKVIGCDDNGNIIIDPNSAVGILEEYKKKYPDFNVTATFFINGGLFNQDKYNDEIIKWLIDNNYDIGNHTYSHPDITTITKSETIEEVGKMYEKLSNITSEYINVVALPFGSPYDSMHNNFPAILDGTYNGKEYHTDATLRVGWEASYSPFSKKFNKNFLKRIRAYDNDGNDFDIEMNFKMLENNRFISDGDKNTITIKEKDKQYINENIDKKYIYY